MKFWFFLEVLEERLNLPLGLEVPSAYEWQKTRDGAWAPAWGTGLRVTPAAVAAHSPQDTADSGVGCNSLVPMQRDRLRPSTGPAGT